MKLGARDTLLTLGTAGAMLVGVVLILAADAMLTMVGIMLVVLSAIVFVVDAKDVLVKTDRNAGE